MPLSRRTLAALANSISNAHSAATLDLLAYELDLETAAVGPNKLTRSLGLVRALELQCNNAGSEQPLRELVVRTLQPLTAYQLQHHGGLLASLRIDGLRYENGALLPDTPEPVALAPQVSALEQQLNARGLNVAVVHYRQAVDNLTAGQFEAANGSLRPFLESLFTGLCNRATNQTHTAANPALLHLRQQGLLAENEWNLCRSLWANCHTNGPHPGLSNEEEALFRLHFGTSLARYLLSRIPEEPIAQQPE